MRLHQRWFKGKLTITASFDAADLTGNLGTRKSCGAQVQVSSPSRGVIIVSSTAPKLLDAVNGFNCTLRDYGCSERADPVAVAGAVGVTPR